jgi:hypothetical protein
MLENLANHARPDFAVVVKIDHFFKNQKPWKAVSVQGWAPTRGRRGLRYFPILTRHRGFQYVSFQMSGSIGRPQSMTK